MYRRVIIGLIVLTLIFMLFYKQSWSPFTDEELQETDSTAPAVSEEMQKAFDAGQGVWLVFSSDTCPACVELEKVAAPVKLEYNDQISYIRVDVNDAANRDLLQQYPVTYIPASFIMDKDGIVIFSAEGVLTPEEIRAELDKVVSD